MIRASPSSCAGRKGVSPCVRLLHVRRALRVVFRMARCISRVARPYVRPKVGDQVDAAESEATQRHLHQFRKEKKQNDKMQKLLAVCGTNVRVRFARACARAHTCGYVRARTDACA